MSPEGPSAAGTPTRRCSKLMIAMSGSFDVVLDGGETKKRIHLNRSYFGLYICPVMWREIDNFSSGSVCMVLASTPYDAADYIREYEEFRRATRQVVEQ